MHIRNYPQVFIKDGKQRNVYYTAEARDLISLGWKQQSAKTTTPSVSTKEPEQPAVAPVIAAQTESLPPIEQAKPTVVEEVKSEVIVAEEVKPEVIVAEEVKPEVIVAEVIQAEQEFQAPVFESFTRTELLKYALDRGVDLPNNSLKAELVEACKALK